MCLLSIKVPIRKKSGNLFNEPRTKTSLNSDRPNLVLIKKKQRTCYIVDFAVTTDHRVKIKVSEKIDKYLDVAGELKK